MTTSLTEAHAGQRSPQPPHLHYTCPHCGGALDLATLPITLPGAPALARNADTPPFATRSPTTLVSQQISALLARWFPISSALCQRAGEAAISPPQRVRRLPHWWRSAILMLPLVLALLWLIWQWMAGSTLRTLTPAARATTIASPVPAAATLGMSSALTADQAAVLAVVAHYNAAEMQVAATLSLDPSRPFLDPAGPLFQRRSQDLAIRRANGATHLSRLLRWAVGTIEVDAAGTTATIVTQETWQNQERDATPQTATVRLTYTLRRTDTQAPWLIYDAIREIL